MDEWTFIDAQELQEYHVTSEAVEIRDTQYAREGEIPLRDPTEPWRPNRSEGWERREILRLAEELEGLRREHEAQKALLEHELTAGIEEIRGLKDGAVARERARIRRELLALWEASPAGPPHLYDVDINRICPE